MMTVTSTTTSCNTRFFMTAFLFLSLATGVYMADTTRLRRNVDDFTATLTWAPLYLRHPYVTFLNEINHPSWLTRSPISKHEENLRHLRLPKGVPFAVWCGACFERSFLKTNLTISISGHEYVNVAKKRHNHKLGHGVGHNECIMTYLVSSPIKRDGQVTCTLTRGIRETTETISFSAVSGVEIHSPPEELVISPKDGRLDLQCPTPKHEPTRTNPIIHVWHHHNNIDGPPLPIPSMKSTITLPKPHHGADIVCSVYHIENPRKVYQSRFIITGTKKSTQRGGGASHHQIDVKENILLQEETELIAEAASTSSSIFWLIVIAAVVCTLLGLIGIYRLVSAARRR